MSTRRLVRLVPVLAILLLALTGCSEEARENIVDRIQGIGGGGEASPDPTEEPTATSEPVEPTEEPLEPTEEPAEPTEEPTEDATEEPTEEPAPTEEPTDEPEPEPAPTEETADEQADAVEDIVDDGLPWWLGALSLLLLVWLVVALLRRRRRLVARRARLRDAVLAEADWLLERARERPVSVDAAARARDVRLRSDRLGESIQELRTAVPPAAAQLCGDLQTSTRQLTDAVITRLDDVARTGEVTSGLGVAELADRARADRDALATELGRPPARG